MESSTRDRQEQLEVDLSSAVVDEHRPWVDLIITGMRYRPPTTTNFFDERQPTGPGRHAGWDFYFSVLVGQASFFQIMHDNQ